jgi:hypothetical protein
VSAGVERLVVQPPGVRQNPLEFDPVLLDEAALRIVDQQAVFEVQPPGPRIDVAAGHQRVVVVDQQPLQMIAVVFVPPEVQVEQSLRSIAFWCALQKRRRLASYR